MQTLKGPRVRRTREVNDALGCFSPSSPLPGLDGCLWLQFKNVTGGSSALPGLISGQRSLIN